MVKTNCWKWKSLRTNSQKSLTREIRRCKSIGDLFKSTACIRIKTRKWDKTVNWSCSKKNGINERSNQRWCWKR